MKFNAQISINLHSALPNRPKQITKPQPWLIGLHVEPKQIQKYMHIPNYST